ncbi:Arylsulfatase K [Cricetulus griseus]|uniref:Arylsulfatase K n=1 Tax=Cricetulus griseus TaxID=10029 RepID=G3H759_CRIGR|nr:Arylsulfatase K [Cricetulus griseus]
MLLLWVSTVAASAIAAPTPGTQEQKLQVAQAPNVVLVASDSFDGRLTFQPGSGVVKLPFINFMRAHGTTFLNAYTNSPICCPSRAGEIILTLRKLDLLQKTIVIYTSDHGEMAMEHRQFYKMSMYEASAHVPLLMMGPGIKVNVQVPNFVSLVDIYPTMLEAPADEQMRKTQRQPWVLSEFHGCNANASTYMLRTGQWKYIAYSDGASVHPQLFEIANSALNPFVYLFFQAGDCGLWRRLRRRLGFVCCVREGEAEINEGAGDHQALHRHRWPHPHYHHARREERDQGCLRPPPPRPRPPPCSCESAF